MNISFDKKQTFMLHTGMQLRTAQWSDLNAVVDLIREVLTADGDAVSAVTPG